MSTPTQCRHHKWSSCGSGGAVYNNAIWEEVSGDLIVCFSKCNFTRGRCWLGLWKVFATGFSLSQYDVDRRGRNGRTRQEHWNRFGCIQAFETVAMAEFPNFLYILGPNSGRGHTSTVYSIERYDACAPTVTHRPLLILTLQPRWPGNSDY